jgi:phosphoribosylamine-glycine ligase
MGKTFKEARQKTYEAIGKIKFENMFYRKDIAKRVEE